MPKIGGDEQYDNELRGAIFRVDEDKRTERGPDMRGTVQVAGQEYKISGWTKTAKSGKRYLSIALTLDKAVPAAAPKQEAPPIDEDIPF